MAKPQMDPHQITANSFTVKRFGEREDPKKMPPVIPVGVANNPQVWSSLQGMEYLASHPYGDGATPIRVDGANIITTTSPWTRDALFQTGDNAEMPSGNLPLMQPASPLPPGPIYASPPIEKRPDVLIHPGTGRPIGRALPVAPTMAPPPAAAQGRGQREKLRSHGTPYRQGPPAGARVPPPTTEMP